MKFQTHSVLCGSKTHIQHSSLGGWKRGGAGNLDTEAVLTQERQLRGLCTHT